MLKFLPKLLLLSVFMFSMQFKSYATHAMGGDVWYECNGGNDYTIFFAFYRDCDGVNAPNTINISYSSSCTGTSNLTLTRIPNTGQDITPVCPGQQTSCGGGNFQGVQKYVYSATVTLAPCDDWVFSTSICCRNNAITNINNPGGQNMYLQATLDNLNNPCNSSPEFTSDPVPYVCVGETFCFNHGAIDAEGDSISFSLIVPYDQGPTDPVTYDPGFSAGQPISSNPAMSFNPATGDICMTPQNLEVSVTAVVVEHWHNGVLVGTIMRDIQIVAINCNNVLPTVDGIDATNDFTTSACAGSPITFTTNGADNNAGNLLEMSWNAGIPGATFNITGNGTTNPVGTFSWTPTMAQVSNTPYCFTVRISDDQCPLNGFQIYSFCITVGAGNVTANAVGTDPTCNGLCDGEATVAGAGGTAPYTYSTDGVNYSANDTYSGLCAGSYDLYAMDANGCSSSDNIILTDPAPMVLTTSATNVLCNGGANGIAGVTVAGGTAPYTYLWSNGPTVASNTGLAAGSYDVTVTDANGCQEVATVVITEPAILTATSTPVNPSCDGNDGEVTVNVTGGVAPYTYEWLINPTLTGATQTGLIPGVYDVEVTDANNCTVTTTATLVVAGAADASFTYNGNQCLTGNDYAFTNQGSAGAGVMFEWDFGDGSGVSTAEDPNYTYLTSGAFDVTHIVSDGLCSDTLVTTIQVYTEPTLSHTQTDVSCNGGNDGAIDLTVTGGTPNFGFLWNTNAINQDLNNLIAGTYTVQASDNNGCLAFDTVEILEPTALVVVPTFADATCDGVCDGTAEVVVSGGVGPYSYDWDNPSNSTTAAVIGLCAGNFTATVTDDNGCIITEDFTIINTDTLFVDLIVTPSSCGQPDGAIEAQPSGGTPGYNYVWTPTNQTTAIAVNLPSGNYNVVVTDLNGCSATATESISDIPAPTATIINSQDILCNGDTTGSAEVEATGGTGVYTYNWLPAGGAGTIANNLSAGFYTVTVTDDAGCVSQASVTLTQPNPLVLQVGSVNANCGLSDGQISAVAAGGVPGSGYQYEWSNGVTVIGTTATMNVATGTYYVTVTDDNACTIMDSVVVGENPPGTVTTLATDETCQGACNGSGIATITGGTAPYQFQWNDPNATFGQSALGLCAGRYIVSVTDAIGCIVRDTINIESPPKLFANIDNETPVSCFGFTDGIIEASSAGGTPPVSFQWDVSAGSQTTATASGLAPGTYTLVATDANGCTASTVGTIAEPAEIVLQGSGVNAHCGLSDGIASVQVTSGGVQPFSYSWIGSPSTTNIANGVPQGSFNVTVTDADGCQADINVAVGDTPAGTPTITNAVNPTCFNSCNGIASVSMSGTGTAPYTYSWDDPNNQTGVFASGLCGGVNYTVTVTDANGCVSTNSVSLTDPVALSVTLSPSDAICFNECTGAMGSNVQGGTAPYTYLWNDPAQQITATAVNLCANTPYTLTVRDANNCLVTGVNSLGQPTAIEIDSTVTNSFCGQAGGSACITVSGGVPGYDINWVSLGSTNLCETGLAAGTYLIEVTDLNDCAASSSVTVSDISGPTSYVDNISNVSCAGGASGQATAVVSGGTAPYSYLWDANAGSQTSPTASNLDAGSYTYSIVDSAGCTTSGVVNITEPTPLVVSAFAQNPICSGGASGGVTTTVFGGVGPYTYSWLHNGAVTTANVTGLPAGVYAVNVTDANGCTDNAVVTLVDPAPVNTSLTKTNVNCNGTCSGTATATSSNGTLPYSYVWDDVNQQTTQTASGLCAGTYQVIVSDVNGCRDTASIIIAQPDSLLGSISLSGNVTCNGACDGYAEAAGTGGTMPYTYLWSNGSTNQLINNLCPGNYGAIISDANGCTVSITQAITQPLPLNGTMLNTSTNCFGSCNGSAQLVLSGGTGPYTYQWNDPSFQTTALAQNLCAGAYSVTAFDNNGCAYAGSTTVSQPSSLSVTSNVTNSNCGQSNGMACVNVIGGVSPYTYQWTDPNSQTTACAMGVPSGTYNVTVNDANNCSINETINITDLSGPAITLGTVTDVSCNGFSDGGVEMNVAGGTMPYQTYEWLDGNGLVVGAPNTSNINGVEADCYTLHVVDNVGCSASQTVCVDEPNVLNSSFVNVNAVSCFGDCNGSATVVFSGGTNPVGILWGGGQTTATVNNLCPGNTSVTLTDGNGCTASNSVNIAEPSPLTTVQVGTATTSCNSSCDGTVQVTSLGGTPPYAYSWSPGGASSNTANGLCAGTYVAQTTDANGCQINTNYTVAAPPVLTGTISSTNSTCGLCNATAILTASGGTTPYSYQWQNSQTTSLATNVCSGNFAGTIIDANGCQLNLSTNVANTAGPSITGFSTTNLQCNGDNTGEATVLFVGGTAPITYSWTGNQNTATVSNLAAGNICVQITDGNGCVDYDCIGITEPNVLNGVPDQNATVCYGDSAQIWASATGGTSPYSFTWLPPDDNIVGTGPHYVTPNATHSYCFTVEDANGCVSQNNSCIDITVTPPLQIDILDSLGICNSDSINIQATVTGGDGSPYQFAWYYDDVNTSSIATTQNLVNYSGDDGMYYLTVNDGCSLEAQDSTLVLFLSNPNATILVDDSTICFPDSVVYTVLSDNGVNFEWDFNSDGVIDYTSSDTTATFSYSGPGLYDVTVIVESDSGCIYSFTDLAAAEVFAGPTAEFSHYPTTLSILSPQVVVTDESSPVVGWEWDFNADGVIDDTDQNSNYEFNDIGEYPIMLSVVDSNGCVDTVTHIVEVIEEYQFFVPNTFTPDGDGLNDFFFAEGSSETEFFKMEVYDRWGLLIWEGFTIDRKWDGTYKDKPCQMDTYVWKIEVMYPGTGMINKIGHVNLLR